MSGIEEESYLDRLLSSMEEQEAEEHGQEFSDDLTANAIESHDEDMLDAFASAGMLLSPLDVPEIEAEAFMEDAEVLAESSEMMEEVVEASELTETIDEVKEATATDMTPDFADPDMSESDMERLNNMELDSLIEDVKADAFTVEELLDDNVVAKEDAPTVQSDALETKSVDEQQVDIESTASQEAQTVADSATVAPVISAEAETTATENQEETSKKGKKAKKEKAPKDKSKKGGFGAVLKSIFFESTDATAETEAAKKKGKKAAQEAKNNAVKDQESGLKDTVLNENGEKEVDENQKLLKEMYGKGQQEEVAPKQSFFDKLKYRLSLFMKKNAEEDAAEDAAEAKEYEEKQKIKAEKQEADKVKKEEAKAEREKKAEEAKAKKAAKQKQKKPKPEPKPGDILKIKPQSMFLFIMFVVGAIALIIILNNTISYNSAVSSAKAGMQSGNYAKAYEALSGMELKGNDVVLYEQASVIMYVQRHYESYENYKLMGRPTEALDALITGLVRYETYYMRAVDLGVDKQIIAIREKMLKEITDAYGISSTEAIALANLSMTDYTQYYIKIQAY